MLSKGIFVFVLACFPYFAKSESWWKKKYELIRQDDSFLYDVFPQDFEWGVGTAAYQVEGAWNEDGICSLTHLFYKIILPLQNGNVILVTNALLGKGESIWDTFSHENNGAVGELMVTWLVIPTTSIRKMSKC